MTFRLKRKKKIFCKFFFIFSAGRVWYTITPPIGKIEKFCFRPSSSFAIAMTARLKRKKILDKFFFIFSAGRVWYTITLPIGEIEKFCFRPSSSFSIAMTARLAQKPTGQKIIFVPPPPHKRFDSLMLETIKWANF